jgi:hypothetical protein
MFAIRQNIFQPRPVRFRSHVKKSITRSYYGLNYDNSRKLEMVHGNDLFHVLAFHRAGHEEGIYSITERDENDHPLHSIVAFLTFDDAYRDTTLLEAEMDSYHPYIQFASRYELDHVCRVGGYQCLVVNEGVLVTPPMKTVKLTDWEIRESLMNGNWTVAPKPENPREQ